MKANIVCIIDDDIVYQITTKKILEKINGTKKIIVFSNGEEAFNYLSKVVSDEDALPDIILLDVNMPYMNAWQFLEAYSQLKSLLTKQIIIYIISSSVSDIDIQKAKSIEEVKDYFIKPISIAQYTAMLSI
jgi:CheY-like chemotaxis protein